MESTDSRLAALESRLARWRLLSVVLALATGAGAFAAARAFPPRAPAPTELRLADDTHTAVLTPRGLELQAPLGSPVSLSVDDGLALDRVTLNRFGLTVREDDRVAALSSDALTMRTGDGERVKLASEPSSQGELVLGDATGNGPTAALRVGGDAATLRVGTYGAGSASLSMLAFPVLCAEPQNQPGACADLRDIARVARPR